MKRLKRVIWVSIMLLWLALTIGYLYDTIGINFS
jgi:hypothetical protein